MPFTANRDFKKKPRIIVGAQATITRPMTGARFTIRFPVCGPAAWGTAIRRIVAAVQKQVATLDYAMGFQAGHDKVFELAEKVTELAPEPFRQIFFTNSGSESVDTALKIALAYHRSRGRATAPG